MPLPSRSVWKEGLDAETQFILEAAAYVHDIGIHQGEIKYGRNDGMIQQELGPKEALPMLKRLHFTQAEIDRILWLIAHHHSYGSIDGTDAQILAEADMLVNQFEDGASDEQNKASITAYTRPRQASVSSASCTSRPMIR